MVTCQSPMRTRGLDSWTRGRGRTESESAPPKPHISHDSTRFQLEVHVQIHLSTVTPPAHSPNVDLNAQIQFLGYPSSKLSLKVRSEADSGRALMMVSNHYKWMKKLSLRGIANVDSRFGERTEKSSISFRKNSSTLLPFLRSP